MKIVLTILLSSITFIAHSEQIEPTKDDQKQRTFGFKGGLNHSVINGHELDDTKTGYVGYEVYGSLFSNSKLNDKLNLENEVLVSFTDEYLFIEIPIHLKYKFHDKWTFLMGPKIDFIPSELTHYEIKPMGVSAELGVQYDINKRYFAELRVSKGFTKQVNDFVLEIYDGKRNTFRFGLGINF